MRNFLIILFCISIYYLFISKAESSKNIITANESAAIIPKEKANYYSFSKPATIGHIPTPQSYTKIKCNAFGNWLRNRKLNTDKALYLHNKSLSRNQSSHYAVLNVPYNFQPLQQCADAVMRLRAEYLYETKSTNEISFIYSQNKTYKISSICSRQQLEKFLHLVFAYCGTYTLESQLKKKDIHNIQPGDVLIRGGSPGHAMIVADVAENETGERIFLLAQSFIPAQNIHIVKNPNNQLLSPWYPIDELIKTPGFTFKNTELKTW